MEIDKKDSNESLLKSVLGWTFLIMCSKREIQYMCYKHGFIHCFIV